MQQFTRDGQTYWGGLHRTLGVLIYDANDQRGLPDTQIRLYIVNQKRLVTFAKSVVFLDLVPTRLETWWCRHHQVVMQSWHNVKGSWWSHRVADGTWCPGRPRRQALRWSVSCSALNPEQGFRLETLHGLPPPLRETA